MPLPPQPSPSHPLRTPKKSASNRPLMDPNTHRHPRPHAGRAPSCTRPGRRGSRQGADSHGDAEAPGSGKQVVPCPSGPRQSPSLLSPQPDACHICEEPREAHSILTQARSLLPFQGAQPPWVHPLGRPTPQEKQMVRACLGLALPEPSCCTDVGAGGRGGWVKGRNPRQLGSESPAARVVMS